MEELIKTGKIIRPWVGIGLQDLTPELMNNFNVKEKEGALISQIYEGSPAEKADLKTGDIIIQIDGKKIKDSQDVVREVLKRQVGQKILFEVIRDGKHAEIAVITAQMPSELGEQRPARPAKEWFGLRVSMVTPDIAKQLGLAKAEGVIIEGVEMGSAAQDAGLRKGDVILEVNRQRIKDENDYRDAMEKVKPDQAILLLISREGSTFFVSLKEEK
jgi:serine protease Do